MNPKCCGFVLAAGEGRRMRPATLLRPKALLPFCGVPLLELAVEELLALPGISPVLVNACYLGEQVEEACRELAAAGRPVRCVREERLLNHGGGLRNAVEKLCPEAEQVVVHNVDIVHNYDLRLLLEEHRRTGAAATLLLIPNHRQNGVSLQENGEIRSFHDTAGDLTFSGLYVLQREILDFLPRDREAPGILEGFRNAALAGRAIRGIVAPKETFWSDVGTAEEYIQAHGQIVSCDLAAVPRLQEARREQEERRQALEKQGVRCTGALGLGKNLTLAPGTHLHNVVLWDDSAPAEPILYAEGILFGKDSPSLPQAITPDRQPDPRILQTLGLSADEIVLEPLAKQGSGRKYCRLSRRDGEGLPAVWSAYNPRQRGENAAFVAVDAFLRRLGIAAPKLLLHLPDVGEILSEDLGDEDLLHLPPERQPEATRQVLRQAARLHTRGAAAACREGLPLQPPFTQELYHWERDYFRTHLLQNVLHHPEWWDDGVAAECERLCGMLLSQPQALLHRDLQSANVKWREGEAVWIDFQGMRLGAAAYDVASFLYDPYQDHTKEFRHSAWQAYGDFMREEGGEAPEELLFHAAALQRLMQALGAYGKLWLQDGLVWYRDFLVPGIRHFREAAREAAEAFPAFLALAEKLEGA